MNAEFDPWEEERHYRRDAIKGSLKLLQALLRMQDKKPPVIKQAKKLPPLPVAPFPSNPTCWRIQKATADYYGFDAAYLFLTGRSWWHSHPRQVAMYLAHTVYGISFPKVASHFGRDHTTVIHACRTVPEIPQMLADAQAIRKMLMVPVKTGDIPALFPRNSQEDVIEHSENTQEERLAA